MYSVASLLGWGGSKLNKELKRILTEQQGFRQAVFTGPAANADGHASGAVAGPTVIRGFAFGAGFPTHLAAPNDDKQDTIKSVINLTNLTDVTPEFAIANTHATGTITVSGTPLAGETLTVRGVVYTFRAAASPSLHEITISAVNATQAANIASVINRVEAELGLTVGQLVHAFAVAAVVTVNATYDETAGNAYTLAETATGVAVSGATFTDGTATGGVYSAAGTSVGDALLLTWYDQDNLS